jgi:hypothetical protein
VCVNVLGDADVQCGEWGSETHRCLHSEEPTRGDAGASCLPISFSPIRISMMAALVPNQNAPKECAEEQLHSPAADNSSIEVVVIPEFFAPALDFSTLPVEEADPDRHQQGDEWDPHRVYFSEFLAEPKADPAPPQFSPFSVAGSDDDELAATGKEVEHGPDWTSRPWVVQRDQSDDKVASKQEKDYVDHDDELDPLGWPRPPARHVSEATGSAEEDVGGVEDDDEDIDGDDEDLLGPGRRGRSDNYEDATEKADAGAVVEVETEDKIHRLEQYAAVEPDEASVAANSAHSSDPNHAASDDDEEEHIEVQYQTQEDDDDESDYDDDFRDEFQDLILQMAQKEKSDGFDHGTEALQMEFATLGPGTAASATTPPPPAFEVTWTEEAAESSVSVTHVTAGQDGATLPRPATSPATSDVLDRKPAPLLKPPPEEKLQKWLAAKDKS